VLTLEGAADEIVGAGRQVCVRLASSTADQPSQQACAHNIICVTRLFDLQDQWSQVHAAVADATVANALEHNMAP
jgi:hypothetical protein